jgi:1,4-alpha-glucan branching enzyme
MTREFQDGTVEFRFHRPQADSAHLVGDFNSWDPRAQPMHRNVQGEWVCRLALPPGVFRFRYIADGEWFTDYCSFGAEPCPFGWNSVLIVGKTGRTVRAGGRT